MKVRVLLHLTLSLGKNRRKCTILGKCIQFVPSLVTLLCPTELVVPDWTLVCYRPIYLSILSYTRHEQIPATIPCYLAFFTASPRVPWKLILSLQLGNLRILALILICLRYRLLRCLFTYGPT